MRMDREVTLQTFELAEIGGVLTGRWRDALPLFAGREERSGFTVFAAHGAARFSSTRFLVRAEGEVTPAMRLVEDGVPYLLAAVSEKGLDFLELTAVRLPFRPCSVTREVEREGSGKASVRELREALRFPAVLTEKYQRFEQREPMAVTQSGLVLVTPKAVLLETNDLVAVEGHGKLAVHARHILDEYKNEYELYREEDV